MSNGKGKERATDVDDKEARTAPAELSPSEKTIFDRLATSATSLARSTFAAPTRNELNNTASAAQSSSGKPQQFHGTDASEWDENLRPSQPSSSNLRHSPPSAPFRSSHSDQHIANAEAEFSAFLDGTDAFTPSAELETRASGELEPTSHAHIGGYDTSLGRPSSSYPTIQEQQAHDGDEVLAILSDGRSENLISSNEYKAIEEDPVVWHLTAKQREEWQSRLKTDFPPPAPHTIQHPYMPFNLVPAFDTDPIGDLRGSGSQDSSTYFGRNMSADDARDEWIAQWHTVLVKYVDDVWGDLLPLVIEAREEVEALRKDPEGSMNEQPKALRRLGQILEQLRK